MKYKCKKIQKKIIPQTKQKRPPKNKTTTKLFIKSFKNIYKKHKNMKGKETIPEVSEADYFV